MPVLPDVASISVSPGLMSPRFSASTIIDSAGRSLTEPAGLLPSSLAEHDVRRVARQALQADERRVADGGFERGVHRGAVWTRHCSRRGAATPSRAKARTPPRGGVRRRCNVRRYFFGVRRRRAVLGRRVLAALPCPSWAPWRRCALSVGRLVVVRLRGALSFAAPRPSWRRPWPPWQPSPSRPSRPWRPSPSRPCPPWPWRPCLPWRPWPWRPSPPSPWRPCLPSPWPWLPSSSVPWSACRRRLAGGRRCGGGRCGGRCGCLGGGAARRRIGAAAARRCRGCCGLGGGRRVPCGAASTAQPWPEPPRPSRAAAAAAGVGAPLTREIWPLILPNSPSLMPLTFMMSSGDLNGPLALR